MDLGVFNRPGEVRLHRHLKAAPEPFLQAMAPDREDLVVAIEWIFTWYGLADLGARERIPFGLGQALCMKAIPGGKAQNDTLAAHQMAGLLRGGMLPQADVEPAAMRAPRALLRRRLDLPRQRAALLAHSQTTNSQDHWPELGKKLADNANRDGVAERCPDPAGHKSLAVDRALLGSDDPRLNALELQRVHAAKPHGPTTLDRLQTGPGIGNILRLVLREELHDIQRFPSGPEVVSSCRLVTCAQAAAGQRDGTAGATIGHASLPWAFAEAAGLLLRDHPPGQNYLTRLEKHHGQGHAFTLLAQQLGRAIYDRLQRHQACEMPKLFQAS